MPIKITGVAKLRVPFEVELNHTQAEWDSLTEREQDEVLDEHIDWYSETRNAEVEEFDID